ncbi:MAG: DUF4062 domain-containing protein [Burkholderiales bacterium]|nr:DUF4062 domain-containing protein [Burkholderiales bacterium]MDR4516984.1 DUF4062 domain-containing protein [Nitrosomonas sp.]
MTAPRSEIFISAATSNLGSCRQLIKEALLTLHYAPVEQTNFPPDARRVQEKLREKITACHAVIHVAGIAYGGEPVYVFVCSEDFPTMRINPKMINGVRCNRRTVIACWTPTTNTHRSTPARNWKNVFSHCN